MSNDVAARCAERRAQARAPDCGRCRERAACWQDWRRRRATRRRPRQSTRSAGWRIEISRCTAHVWRRTSRGRSPARFARRVAMSARSRSAFLMLRTVAETNDVDRQLLEAHARRREHPERFSRPRKHRRAAKHANDRVFDAVYVDRCADGRCAVGEQRSGETLADHDRLIGRRRVGFGEHATRERMHTEQREVVRRDRGEGHLGKAFAIFDGRLGTVGDAPIAPAFVVVESGPEKCGASCVVDFVLCCPPRSSARTAVRDVAGRPRD